MSYYGSPMGDYRTYGYAGDPGFLSSLWRGVKKIALPIIGGMIAGPMGAAVGTAVGGSGRTPPIRPMAFGGPQVVGQVTMPGGASFSGGVQLPTKYKYPRAIQGQPPPVAAAGPGGPGAGMIPSGYHYAKDGSGRLVRNRRMNVANPRALRRSMRRVQGFEKLARRTIVFTRRVKMKKRKST